MEMPKGSPYLCPTLGVDKAMVVRGHLDSGRTVSFAGDGFPDAEAARLVTGDLRFARADLADLLDREGLEFQPFETWSDIARVLLARGNGQ
jgi:2-hydroxy-3-keto-5-methylthiopentenyl-1-phosphate phosphatase